MNEKMQEKTDSEILFSRMVKAGKRIYYIDVKRDRRDEYYMAITESKRVKDATETSKAVFEKHKIFLYREDVAKFKEAFCEVSDYVSRASGEQPGCKGYGEEAPGRPDSGRSEGLGGLDLNIEF